MRSDSEQFDEILSNGGIKIERIVSFGHPTPNDQWYDQEETEWVALLKGAATLGWEDGSLQHLTEGDHIIIPPHLRHRVEQVSEDAIWIGCFFKE